MCNYLAKLFVAFGSLRSMKPLIAILQMMSNFSANLVTTRGANTKFKVEKLIWHQNIDGRFCFFQAGCLKLHYFELSWE